MKIAIGAPLVKSLKPLAKEYRCDLEALVTVALEEMIAAHQPTKPEARISKPARATKPAPVPVKMPGRAYAEKPCATCGEAFAPLGPRAKFCARCRNAAPATDSEMETVWTPGRNAASLTGDQSRSGMRF